MGRAHHSFPCPSHGRKSWVVRGAVMVVVLGLLTACGGGRHGTDSESAQARSAADATRTDEAALLARGAQINRDTLARAASEARSGGQSAAQASIKAAAVRTPAYRFYNSTTGAHFYTISATERDQVQATLSPPFIYEGEAFSVAAAFSAGLSPVHRFYNTQTGVHFYTISEEERAHLVASVPSFHYEGVAYHASQVSGVGLLPLYRFYPAQQGHSFLHGQRG